MKLFFSLGEVWGLSERGRPMLRASPIARKRLDERSEREIHLSRSIEFQLSRDNTAYDKHRLARNWTGYFSFNIIEL